jgi:hypothetical protein
MIRDISFVTLILSLIIYKQRVPSSMLLLLTEEAPLLVFLVLATLVAYDTLNLKPFSHRVVHLARGQIFLYQTIQLVVRAELALARFLGDQENFAFCKSSSHHSGFLRVPPKSSFKKLLLGTKLWQHAKNEYLPQGSRWVEGR